MTLPKVLVTSPIRYRPDCPEVLDDFVQGIMDLEWPEDRLDFHFAVHGDDGMDGAMVLDTLHGAFSGRPGMTCHLYGLGARPDSRSLAGPRRTGETQENLAFLRSRLMRRFQESDADLMLMVDSDVVLAPSALAAMVQPQVPGELSTVSLQIDNAIAEDHEPHSNGSALGDLVVVNGREGYWFTGERAPWAGDGSTIEVARAGACTLYPRAATRYRFHWEPGYYDEQDMIFDRMRKDGWVHYLIRDPSLADHRMKRDKPLASQIGGRGG